MANKPLLSICIPTYNRAEFLKDALDSILRQINENNKDKVEICISDNASEDNTEKLVEEYQKRSPISIIYHKNEKNMGADYNYLKVVEIANGEYCWLLGSDDIIEKGGVDTVVNEIEKNRDVVDIFIVKQKGYDCELKNKINLRSPLINDDGNDILFNNSVNALTRVELWDWGYISAMVINRKKWISIKGYEKWIGSAYVHVYIIYSMMKQGSRVKFVNKCLVGWRSGNDSFLNELKIYGRFKIDLNYIFIAKEVFGKDSEEYKIIEKMLINTPVLSGRIINAKLNCVSYDIYIKMFKDIYPIGCKYPRFWIWYIPLFLTPSFVYKIVRPVVKGIKNIKRKV